MNPKASVMSNILRRYLQRQAERQQRKGIENFLDEFDQSPRIGWSERRKRRVIAEIAAQFELAERERQRTERILLPSSR